MMKKVEKSKVTYYEVDSEQTNRRIDNYLLTKLKGLPRSRLYHLLRKGEIRVNKKRIKPDYRLQAGDQIRVAPVNLSPTKTPNKASDKLINQLKASILYEDEKLLAINKPAGIAVHGGSGLRLGLIEALRQIYPEHKNLELVHRLDRETSGCLLIAKKPSVLRALQDLWREGKVDKRYHVLTLGHWKNTKNIVEMALEKNILQSGERMVKAVRAGGKKSKTIFYQLNQFNASSLMEAELLTGRTHQIRVHTATSGHPIAGDEKYGDKAFNKLMHQKGLNRMFLHASKLSLILPWNHKKLALEADLPAELQTFLTVL